MKPGKVLCYMWDWEVANKCKNDWGGTKDFFLLELGRCQLFY